VTNGTWTTTKPKRGDTVSFPTAPYPKPDATIDTDIVPLACVCQDLVLNYDPNEEAAANFICNEPVVMVDGEYTITTNNVCTLYCDGLYVATASCRNEKWTGHHEYGFWCYQDPTGKSISEL
jgi:hypothetical protein